MLSRDEFSLIAQQIERDEAREMDQKKLRDGDDLNYRKKSIRLSNEDWAIFESGYTGQGSSTKDPMDPARMGNWAIGFLLTNRETLRGTETEKLVIKTMEILEGRQKELNDLYKHNDAEQTLGQRLALRYETIDLNKEFSAARKYFNPAERDVNPHDTAAENYMNHYATPEKPECVSHAQEVIKKEYNEMAKRREEMHERDLNKREGRGIDRSSDVSQEASPDQHENVLSELSSLIDKGFALVEEAAKKRQQTKQQQGGVETQTQEVPRQQPEQQEVPRQQPEQQPEPQNEDRSRSCVGDERELSRF